jgi:hypothetical protein
MVGFSVQVHLPASGFCLFNRWFGAGFGREEQTRSCVKNTFTDRYHCVKIHYNLGDNPLFAPSSSRYVASYVDVAIH